eukprot:144243-Prymnesium_polylepis.1
MTRSQATPPPSHPSSGAASPSERRGPTSTRLSSARRRQRHGPRCVRSRRQRVSDRTSTIRHGNRSLNAMYSTRR